KRRRDLARELGHESFHDALLEVRGVDPKALLPLLEELERMTRLAYARLIAELRKLHGGPVSVFDVELTLRKALKPPEERFSRERALPNAYAIYRAFGVDLEQPKLDVTVRDFAFGGQTIGLRIPDDVGLVLNPLPGA